MKKLICAETEKYTRINLSGLEDWEIKKVILSAAERILKRESEHRHDTLVPVPNQEWNEKINNIRLKIIHCLTDLTEYVGYRTFRIK